MSRILKVQSANAPPFNVSRNHIRIDIPLSAGTVDLANSALLLKTKVNTTETAGPVGIHSVRFGKGTQAYPVNALLKNVKLVNQKQGTVEEIQHWNVLSVNMLDKTQSYADRASQAVFGNYNDDSLFGETAFRTLSLTASEEREPVLKIPLRNLFGMCSGLYNTARGVLSVQLETEDIETILGENITYGATNELVCYNIAGVDARNVVKSTATTFTTDNRLNLWAGGRINVIYDDAGGGETELQTIIKSVSRDAATNKMVVELNDDLQAGALTVIKLVQVLAATLAYEISDASIKVVTTSAKEGGGKVVFRTWNLEAVNKPVGTLNYQRDFDLEENCMNAFLMTPTDSLMSANDNVVDYRYRIDGRDTTSESVVVDSQLYQDRLMMTLLNSGSSARNLRSNGKMYPTPVKNVNKKQVLHLSMRHSPASASPVSYLFKQVEREF